MPSNGAALANAVRFVTRLQLAHIATRCAKLLIHRYARTKQPAIIYFISDLDPSGLDLQRAWEQAMENFRVDCIFHRIALTPEQVQAPELNRLAIEVKDSDSRGERYLAEHGARCWEVDILPADDIEAALNADIESWINRKAWKRREREIERARARL